MATRSLLKNKYSPFYNDYVNPDNWTWNFGVLDVDKIKKITPTEHALIADKDCGVDNFMWRGTMKGIFIGSNGPDSIARRRPHKEINVTLTRCFSEIIGNTALEISHKANVIIENSVFRGNWKLSPGIEQENLIQINGGQASFVNCTFSNCRNLIRVKANSKVSFYNCKFSVADIAIIVDGLDNPRKNDIYDGGRGPATVEIHNCQPIKIKTLALCREGGIVSIHNTQNEELYKLDGGKAFVNP